MLLDSEIKRLYRDTVNEEQQRYKLRKTNKLYGVLPEKLGVLMLLKKKSPEFY